MENAYDQHYQTENLFGDPYPELMAFFENRPSRGKVLDLGCGQGRNAIPLARMGYEVVGLDNSTVGIDQMNRVARAEGLNLAGKVGDIYALEDFGGFDIMLLDSMLHFGKKEKAREIALVQGIMRKAQKGTLIVFCLQNTGKKVKTLEEIVLREKTLRKVHEADLVYVFEEEATGHRSTSPYRLLVWQT
jgi:tellurite methyltransferase